MPTPTKGPRLGGSPAHQRIILANLATNLFEHGRITTTEAKARRLRPYAERLITKAKRDDLHHRRQVLSLIRDKAVVHALFTDIGPRYATRPGGYTRITKIGPRKGDNAPMAVIELVEERTFGAAAAATEPAVAGQPGIVTETDEPESDQVEESRAEESGAEVDESAASAPADATDAEARAGGDDAGDGAGDGADPDKESKA